MKAVNLKSSIREVIGKKSTRIHRTKGEIPAILYGHKKEPLNLKVSHREFWQILHSSTSEHVILNLDIEGAKESPVLALVREVQHHPVTGDVLHIDFQRISLDEKLHIGVPVELTGVPIGVKDQGGILDHGVREVTLNVKPMEIPEKLTIDVSQLAIGHSLHVSDLAALYPSYEFVDDPSVTIAHVSAPKKLETLIPAPGAPAEAAVAPEEGEAAEGEEAEAEGEGEKEKEKGKGKES